MSWWFHMPPFWGRPKVVYDFRRCHDDFMWHDFGGPSKSSYDFRWCHDDFMWHDFWGLLKSWSIQMMSWWFHVTSFWGRLAIIYDFMWFQLTSYMTFEVRMMSYDVMMTSSWHHVVPVTTARLPCLDDIIMTSCCTDYDIPTPGGE